MEFPAIQAISPVDGRYRKQTSPLSAYFSEGAIIRYRLKVEIEYFIALQELGINPLQDFPKEMTSRIRQVYLDFSDDIALEIKNIEKTTNHDIKAVENYLRQKWDELGIGKYKEFIHFGLTSQDINNTAFPLALKDAFNEVYLPLLDKLVISLQSMANQWKNIPMLARTHGQPASPTTVGKELMVFVERIKEQCNYFNTIPFDGKFGGATGNLNAHYIAFPAIDWISFSNTFLGEKLGLRRQATTTQIEHYDNLGAFFDNCSRINTILLDFSKDIWMYIALDYFKQKVVATEVGSSAMPHKVNPIDFENAEGNLGLANAVYGHLSSKLPVSRLQRDLTDSTVIRNIGVPFAHSIIAFHALIRGIGKLMLNEDKIMNELNQNWAVIAEAIQTILRRENYPEPYQALKELTRGQTHLTQEVFINFIETLQVPQKVKDELKEIKPENYTGRIGF
ncbi:MAG: adenylosuccinate lyase [Bacteroidales bacterium]